jgi:hypothetical protein
MSKEEEIREIREKEAGRGRRPRDKEYEKLLRTVFPEVEKALRTNDEGLFREAMRALGLKPGSPKYERALTWWRDSRGRPSR